MIDRPGRNELARLLRQLAAGRITTVDFADQCEVLCSDSDDKAIQGVAAGGPDVIHFPRFRVARRLRGPARLSDEMRRKIAVAASFLYSDYEYEWPEDSSFDLRGDCLLMAVCLLLLVLGAFATVFWQLGQISPWVVAACFALAVYVFYFSNVRIEKARAGWIDQCREFGDMETWPFCRQADLDAARESQGRGS